MLSSYRGNSSASSPQASGKPILAQISGGGVPGTGTVTSVALTAPAEFTVAGSPITSSGTLAVTKHTQAANFLWAGPATGADAQPTFRALVPADIPFSQVALKTDGAANSSQSTLNLISGTGITITAGAAGAVTIDGSASGQLPSYTGPEDTTVTVQGGTGAGPTSQGGLLTLESGTANGGAGILAGFRTSSENAQGASITAKGGIIGTGIGGDILLAPGSGQSGSGSIIATQKFFPPYPDGSQQLNSGIYAGAGVPADSGENGDYYFRADGGIGTHIYFRTGGVWVGII